jgi:hypothetical protein
VRPLSMRSLAVFAALLSTLSVSLAKDDLQVGDLVKKHLNSIGTEQARAAVKNCAVRGTVSFQILNGDLGRQDGTQAFVSEGDKFVSFAEIA